MQAIFASGTYAGKHIPLVNEQTATLRMGYRIDAKQSFEGAWRMLGSTYAGSDEANSCGAKVPSSRMLDAHYRWRDKGFEVSLGANNVTNQKTYQYDYNCGSGGYVYPEPGRTFRAALRYNF
jgi:outer membrane receptor protein involved in Fe transport